MKDLEQNELNWNRKILNLIRIGIEIFLIELELNVGEMNWN